MAHYLIPHPICTRAFWPATFRGRGCGSKLFGMRNFLLLTLLCVSLVIGGCGGTSSLIPDADIRVYLTRTDGTQIMTNYEMFITRNGGTLDQSNLENHMSSVNRPSWADQYSATRATEELQIFFRTRSDQTPYFVYVLVPNTPSAFETLRLRIDVNGSTGPNRTFDMPINATTQLVGVRIDRNSASY